MQVKKKKCITESQYLYFRDACLYCLYSKEQCCLCCAALPSDFFFSSTRVQKEGVVDPNTVLSPNFAKIKGIASVLCAAYW